MRPDNTRYDGRFEVPTFDEVLDLVAAESRRTGRRIGVYPETKHPTYFDSIGLSLEEPLVRALKRHHLDRRNAAVIVQSFETGNLRDLDRHDRRRRWPSWSTRAGRRTTWWPRATRAPTAT